MTEAEWLAATDPQPMLEHLRGRASDRKLRLFACACCWRMIHLATDPRSQRTVEVAELFADGLVAEDGCQTAFTSAAKTDGDRISTPDPYTARSSDSDRTALAAAYASSAVSDAARNTAAKAVPLGSVLRRLAEAAAYAAFDVSDNPAFTAADIAEDGAGIAHAEFFRDIFNNPFRPVTAGPSWPSETVVALATGIYAERAFDRMPILADALEEAGCDDVDVLTHCRGPGPHVRGCWVVDRVLGKE
jgi:hypothetical protein